MFRYKNYVFVGDEVFPGQFDIRSRDRIPVKGIVHVVDVSDIERPRKVAEYDVPEAGAHNMWVTDDDVMFMGYYNGGGSRRRMSRASFAATCTVRAARSPGCGPETRKAGGRTCRLPGARSRTAG